jgi:hypothetical protein
MRLAISVEEEDLEMLEVRDVNEPDNEDVLGGKELVSAFAAARDFVKDAVRNEPVEDFPQCSQRGQRLGAVAACIYDLHGRALMLARLRE